MTMDQVVEMLTSPLMQRALLAAVLVGAAAPVVGTFLVQRRMALMGDGIGHVALTGVALGWLVGSWANLVPQDALAVPGAVVAAVIGSVVIELVRERGRTSGDLALALMFYGGIAGGVLLMKVAGAPTRTSSATCSARSRPSRRPTCGGPPGSPPSCSASGSGCGPRCSP